METKNFINRIIMESCSVFHNMNREKMNNLLHESAKELDEATRDELLTHAGKRDKGFYDGTQQTDKNFLKGTNTDKDLTIPDRDKEGNIQRYSRGVKKGQIKTKEVGTVTLQSAAFSPAEFFDKGDLIMIYGYKGSGNPDSNVRTDNGTHLVHVKYKELLQKAGEIFKKNGKFTLKGFESAINAAMDKVDVYVNCQCRDFVQRYLGASKKKDMFFDLKKEYDIQTGSSSDDIIQGTGQRPSQTREKGFCAHIVNAITNKRTRVYRTEFNGQKLVNYLWGIIKNKEADNNGKKSSQSGKDGKHTLLYWNFVAGTKLEGKYTGKVNESFDFIDIMEYAKEYINTDEIAVISGESAEDILEDMNIEKTADLDDYSVYEGNLEDSKVLVVESDTSVYAIYDKFEESLLLD